MDLTAANIYGTAPVALPTVLPQTAMSATDDVPNGLKGLLSPQNPLIWFGAILLITVGAAGVAGAVKLGPAKIAGSVGKTS